MKVWSDFRPRFGLPLGLGMYLGTFGISCAHAATERITARPLSLKLTVSPQTGFAPLSVLASVRAIDVGWIGTGLLVLFCGYYGTAVGRL